MKKSIQLGNEVFKTMKKILTKALDKHYDEHGSFRTLEWFNASDETTDFYKKIENDAKMVAA